MTADWTTSRRSKAPAYAAGDSGFESQYGRFCVFFVFVFGCLLLLNLVVDEGRGGKRREDF